MRKSVFVVSLFTLENEVMFDFEICFREKSIEKKIFFLKKDVQINC